MESAPNRTDFMTSRERVMRALEFRSPDRAPRELWRLDGIMMSRRDEYDEVLKKFPSDFDYPGVRYGPAPLARGTIAEVGTYTDEWGCVWTVAEPGVVGEVKHPPLKILEADLDHFRPPYEILRDADFTRVDRACDESDRFVRAGTTIRPFERLQFLRGTENLFMDLACDTAQIRRLIAMLHEFYMTELELWVKTEVDGISYMDDWGSQNGLLISPDMWRHYFRPLYQDYNNLIHKHGKYVFFHSDGHIASIFPDLIEVGMDAVNSQLFCQDIEELARLHRGKVTFWGEIDRQHILPFGSVDEVRAAVRRVRRALDDGRGGVIAQCEWGNRDPRANIEAVFETWLEHR